MLVSGRIIPTILEKGEEISRIWATAHSLVFVGLPGLASSPDLGFSFP